LLVSADLHCRTVAGRFAFAAPHSDNSFVTVRVHVKSIIAGLQSGERLVGRIDFVFFAIV
jgi:hypothetical protein